MPLNALSRRFACGSIPVFVSLPVQAHSPLSSEGAALWASLLTTVLLGTFWVLYLRGNRRVSAGRWRAGIFHGTVFLCAATVLGPLDEWAKTSTAAHMTQHMLLMVVIAPLWVVCRPLPQLREGGGKWLAWLWRPGLVLAGHPLYAAYLHGAIIWIWHLPTFYMLAVDNPWWHAVEHACFVVSAGVFWWSLLRAGRGRSPWALMALLFTLMHTGFLGALLTFARTPLYGEARDLGDQQLAGLIMWVVAAIPYLLASAWIGHRWLQPLLRDPR